MDSYQAIYDAVRSRISNGDIAGAVREVAWQALDISQAREILIQEFACAAAEMRRPSVLFRPTLSADGSMWCALLGDDLMSGIAGFGETPALAMEAFDKAFLTERTPAAQRVARVPEVVGEVG